MLRKLNTMRMLQTHAPAIFYDPRGTYDVIVFILMRFRPSALIRYVCVFVLIHFQERFHRKRSAHLRVDGTPERIEMYPFSNENALVSTGKLWFLQFACNQEIKSRKVHCSLSLLRLSRLVTPSPTVTNDFSSSVFLSLDKWKAWIYNNTRISDKIWDTTQARNRTGYQFMIHRL